MPIVIISNTTILDDFIINQLLYVISFSIVGDNRVKDE